MKNFVNKLKNSFDNHKGVYAMILGVSIGTFLSTQVMYADSISGLGSWFNDILGQVYSAAYSIVPFLGAVALILVFINKILVRDPQQSAMLTERIKQIIFAMIGIYSIGFIIKIIQNITANKQFTGWEKED